jgi:hypothetical protein
MFRLILFSTENDTIVYSSFSEFIERIFWIALTLAFILSYSISSLFLHTLKRPGMLASVAEALTARGLHIESITTNLQHRQTNNSKQQAIADDDDVDFVIDADCVLSRYLDQVQMQALVQDLRHLQDELQLDTVDIRVQRLAEDPDVQRRARKEKEEDESSSPSWLYD